MSKSTKTHKLGRIEKNTVKEFAMDMRMPMWHPDADDDDGARREIFLEELVGKKNGKMVHFYPPRARAKKDPNDPSPDLPPLIDFKEPEADADPQDVIDFNRWILGHEIGPADLGDPLRTCVRELARLFRCYNASLYRRRRLHFHLKYPNDTLPPKNPYGDDDLVNIGRPIQELVDAAESDWVATVAKLNYAIDQKNYSSDEHRVRVLDVVEVNNYVVSFRVIVWDKKEREQHTADVAQGSLRFRQVGGSSSHVSISSAFSSS